MPLLDFQVQVGAVVIGPGTDYGVATFTGLRDGAEHRSSDAPRAQQHGFWAGRDLLGQRVVTIEFDAEGNDHEHLEELLDAIAAATVIGDEQPISFKLPGQVQRRFYGRCRGRVVTNDPNTQAGHMATVTLRFDCTDPRLYADAAELLTTVRAEASGGLTFNVTFPVGFGGAGVGGVVTATNDGTFPAPWTATLTGPLTNPRIENITADKALAFDLVLDPGDTLMLDRLDKSVLLNGTASRYSSLITSQWFDIDPGANEIRLTADAGTGQLGITFRDTFV
jgi:hypothetical protein